MKEDRISGAEQRQFGRGAGPAQCRPDLASRSDPNWQGGATAISAWHWGITAPPPRPTLYPLRSRSIDGGSISLSNHPPHSGSRPSRSAPSPSPPRRLRSTLSQPRSHRLHLARAQSPPRWRHSGSSPPRRQQRLSAVPARTARRHRHRRHRGGGAALADSGRLLASGGGLTQGRPSRAGARRSRSSARTPALSDLDLRILDLLASHRVLTQTQLASINPETPARTLRYRCARLARHGLAGRSRPYRERGSAPHHLWPTRRGEALVTGGPTPRGGERREPNPLFLAHAAGLSEILRGAGDDAARRREAGPLRA